MSYPMDLDEYTEAQLTAEIRKRKELRAAGLCDYCERPPTATPCKMTSRHHHHETVLPKEPQR